MQIILFAQPSAGGTQCPVLQEMQMCNEAVVCPGSEPCNCATCSLNAVIGSGKTSSDRIGLNA